MVKREAGSNKWSKYVHYTVNNVHYIVFIVVLLLCKVHYTVYNVDNIVFIVRCIEFICTLYISYLFDTV